jgi:hypothetical protein
MPAATQAAQIIQGWPEESREPAQLVIDRRKRPTPYMQGLQFAPHGPRAGDPDERVISEEELKRASEEGKAKASAVK